MRHIYRSKSTVDFGVWEIDPSPTTNSSLNYYGDRNALSELYCELDILDDILVPKTWYKIIDSKQAEPKHKFKQLTSILPRFEAAAAVAVVFLTAATAILFPWSSLQLWFKNIIFLFYIQKHYHISNYDHILTEVNQFFLPQFP